MTAHGADVVGGGSVATSVRFLDTSHSDKSVDCPKNGPNSVVNRIQSAILLYFFRTMSK